MKNIRIHMLHNVAYAATGTVQMILCTALESQKASSFDFLDFRSGTSSFIARYQNGVIFALERLKTRQVLRTETAWGWRTVEKTDLLTCADQISPVFRPPKRRT